jgi:hypothetical protein
MGRRLFVLAIVGAALLLQGAASARADVPRGRVGVGDSIMLSAADELAPHGFSVHAKVGRQFSKGVWVVRDLLRRGLLRKRVVVHLGTNGPIDPADCDTIVELAGPSRRVFLVTNKVPRDWQDTNNAVLNRCAKGRAKVHVIRWFGFSTGHPRWFAADRYHLSALGQAIYASFIDDEIDRILAGIAAR